MRIKLVGFLLCFLLLSSEAISIHETIKIAEIPSQITMGHSSALVDQILKSKIFNSDDGKALFSNTLNLVDGWNKLIGKVITKIIESKTSENKRDIEDLNFLELSTSQININPKSFTSESEWLHFFNVHRNLWFTLLLASVVTLIVVVFTAISKRGRFNYREVIQSAEMFSSIFVTLFVAVVTCQIILWLAIIKDGVSTLFQIGTGLSESSISSQDVINSTIIPRSGVQYDGLNKGNYSNIQLIAPTDLSNICKYAWINQSEMIDHKIQLSKANPSSGDGSMWILRYESDGPSGSSPVSIFNAMQSFNQKKIPNPSFCCFGKECSLSGPYPSPILCPGYYLYLEGKSGYCACSNILQSLGYSLTPQQLVGCVVEKKNKILDNIENIFGNKNQTDQSFYKVLTKTGHAGQATVTQSASKNTFNLCSTKTTETRKFSSFEELSIPDYYNITSFNYNSLIKKITFGGPTTENWISNSEIPEIQIQSDQRHENWGNSNTTEFGDSNLNIILKSSIMSTFPLDLLIKSWIFEENFCYKMKLIFFERCCERGMNIHFNGKEISSNFSPFRLGNGTDSAAIVSFQFRNFQKESFLKIVGNPNFPEKNPMINALIIEKEYPALIEELTSEAQIDSRTFSQNKGGVSYRINLGGESINNNEWTNSHSTNGFSTSDVTVSNWGNSYEFVNQKLTRIVQSVVYHPSEISMNFHVEPHKSYRLQLIIPEQCCERSLDISVNHYLLNQNINVYQISNKKFENTAVIVTCEFFTDQSTVEVLVKENFFLEHSVHNRTNGYYYSSDNSVEAKSGVYISAVVLQEIISADEQVHTSFYTLTDATDSFRSIYQNDGVGNFHETSLNDGISLTWTYEFVFGIYTLDFRYASESSVDMEIFIDGVSAKLLTIPSTKSNEVFMRNNFVLNDIVLTEGTHNVTITKLKQQDFMGPNIHRIHICAAAYANHDGCLLHKFPVPEICYSQMTNRIMTRRVELIDAKKNYFTDLDEALGECASRNDCDGVQETNLTYVLVYGGVGITNTGTILHKKKSC